MIGIDKIYIISYVKNFNQRIKIANQLSYHGITDFEFYYSYDVSEKLINNPHDLNIKHLSVSYAHYDIIKRSYELGYSKIMVFEDDVVFLKDKELFNNVFDSIIHINQNIIFTDYRLLKGNNALCINLQSGYVVDRQGMKFYIENFENNIFLIDQFIYININQTNSTTLAPLIYQPNFNCKIYEYDKTTIAYTEPRLCYQPNNIDYGDLHPIDKSMYFD